MFLFLSLRWISVVVVLRDEEAFREAEHRGEKFNTTVNDARKNVKCTDVK